MENIHKDKENLREYLLGNIKDEFTLDAIEEKLLSDAEFLNELEITEDELIDEYVLQQLDARDLESFQQLFLKNPERDEKINFAFALSDIAKAGSLKNEPEKKSFSFLRNMFIKPQFLYAVMTVFIVGLGLLAGFWILNFNDSKNSLAELKSLHQNERPVEARIVGFDYSPLIVLRGTKDNTENELRRRKIEKDLLADSEQHETAKSLNAIGVFYLTEKKFDEAIGQLEKGIVKYPNDVDLRSNLGAAYLEKAKLQNDDKKADILNKSLAELKKAIELDNTNLEAIFNKALALQEMNRSEEAVQAWKDYLQNDSDSKWADEARRHLSRLEKQ